MIRVEVVTPKINSNTVASFEKAAKKVSTTAKRIVYHVGERLEGKPLDLNCDEIYEGRMLTSRNPYTGKVRYVSSYVLDRLM